MAFTDGKLRIATEQDVRAPWGGYHDGRRFRCAICGKQIIAGKMFRWVYTNSEPPEDGINGNLLVCECCDNSDEKIKEKLRERYKEYVIMRDKFWWFIRYDDGGD